jgi:hypothetical protein
MIIMKRHIHVWKYNGFLGIYVCQKCGAEETSPSNKSGKFPWGF